MEIIGCDCGYCAVELMASLQQHEGGSSLGPAVCQPKYLSEVSRADWQVLVAVWRGHTAEVIALHDAWRAALYQCPPADERDQPRLVPRPLGGWCLYGGQGRAVAHVVPERIRLPVCCLHRDLAALTSVRLTQGISNWDVRLRTARAMFSLEANWRVKDQLTHLMERTTANRTAPSTPTFPRARRNTRRFGYLSPMPRETPCM